MKYNNVFFYAIQQVFFLQYIFFSLIIAQNNYNVDHGVKETDLKPLGTILM